MRRAPQDVDIDIDESMALLYTADEVFAGSGRTTKFGLEEVQLAARQIEVSGVVEDFRRWREEDNAGKPPGGRPRTSPLGDWHVLLA